jgi:hypothetical protein
VTFQKGYIPWIKGRHHTTESKAKMSTANTKKISLKPTEDLGYLCGLIIGDGWLVHNVKAHAYGVGLESSDEVLIQQFAHTIKSVFPSLNIQIYERTRLRKLKNYRWNTPTKTVIVQSKVLYEALKPYKQKDFHWAIPEFLATKESIIGFLQGIYDAEGSVGKQKNKKTVSSIVLSSKHLSNLLQIRTVLLQFGISSRLYRHSNHEGWELRISSKNNMEKFKSALGFRLKRKSILLENLPHFSYERDDEQKRVQVLCG